MLELPKDEDTPQKRVEKIFSNMDKVGRKQTTKYFSMQQVNIN